MKYNKFKNELGNEIRVRIKETKDQNKNVKFNAVSISLIGPTSVSENIITYQEANELHKTLGAYLKEKKIKKSKLKITKTQPLVTLRDAT